MTKQDIAKVLKASRKAAGLETKEVAENLISLGAIRSIKTLYDWESGRSQPDADTFMYLCNLYDVEDVLAAFGYKKPTSSVIPNKDESTLITKYRQLPALMKEDVRDYVDMKCSKAKKAQGKAEEESSATLDNRAG